MGTNYFVVPNRPSVQDPIHIGKSSLGWLFAFHTVNDHWHEPPIIWNTYDQVKEWLFENTVKKTDFVILNEDDEIIPYDDFVYLVEIKQNIDAMNPNNFDHAKNVNGYRFIEDWFR